MSKVKVDEIESSSGGGITAKITSVNDGQLSHRSVIYNGACQIAQRGTSFTSVTATGTFPVDRFVFHVGSLGTWTLSQDTDVPTGEGFSKSIKCDVTTADGSPAAADYARIDHRLEGQDLQRFCKGTANAKDFALSFWVKSSKTGTHIVELQDADNNRLISKAYTVSSANTWEKKELIISKDTTGAFDNDNAKSLTIAWWLAAGSDYTSGTLATSWVTPTNANRVVGQVNCADNTANNFYLTGVQLEPGEVITSYEFKSYQEELAACQRYCVQWDADHNLGMGQVYSGSGYVKLPLALPCNMRAKPSVSKNGDWLSTWQGNSETNGDRDVSVSGMAGANPSAFTQMIFTHNGSSSEGNGTTVWCVMGDASGVYLRLDAEL